MCSSDLQSVAQAAVGVRRIRIADAEREIECALVIPGEDVEVAFRSPAIALPHFVALWTEAESDPIRPHQLVSIVEKQTAFSFLHDNPGRRELKLRLSGRRWLKRNWFRAERDEHD